MTEKQERLTMGRPARDTGTAPPGRVDGTYIGRSANGGQGQFIGTVGTKIG